jgi:glucokinase
MATAHPSYDDTQNLPLVVGVDLGGTQIRTAVLRGAKLISRVSLLTGEDPTPERIIPCIFDAIQQALDEAHVTLDQIAGIGIATPGPLDSRTGVIFAPPNLPGWNRVPLRDIFEEHFSQIPWYPQGAPVHSDKRSGTSPKIRIFVENDANAAALGEYLFGAGRGSRDMVYLTVSTGIGGGVIIDGNIVEGASGTAAELGHMTIDWHGERCNCGNIGCLEYLASGTAIARRANEAIAAGQGAELFEFARALQQHTSEPRSSELVEHDSIEHEHTHSPGDSEPIHISARIVSQAAQAGIPLAHDIITSAAEALGVGLVNIIHIFNPDLIILGGGVTQIGDILIEPALRIVQDRAMAVPRDAVRIVLAELGANTGLVGAGALIYHYSHN